MAALCVVAFAASCGSYEDAGPATTTAVTTTNSVATTTTASPATTTTEAATTTTTTTTTEAEATDEEQIINLVRRFYEVAIEANDPPDPESPLWDEVATPDLASGLRERSAISLDEDEGVRAVTPPAEAILRPKLLLLSETDALVNLCLRDDAVLYRLSTGSTLNAEVVVTWFQYTLVKAPERWLVARTSEVQRFEQEQACVASY